MAWTKKGRRNQPLNLQPLNLQPLNLQLLNLMLLNLMLWQRAATGLAGTLSSPAPRNRDIRHCRGMDSGPMGRAHACRLSDGIAGFGAGRVDLDQSIDRFVRHFF